MAHAPQLEHAFRGSLVDAWGAARVNVRLIGLWSPEELTMTQSFFTYKYTCSACGTAGEERLRGASHDGVESACVVCGETVKLVSAFDTPKSLSDDAIDRARR
jgi:hypothetical protein